MASWENPKYDYVGNSEVVPEIFNRLGENEQYLKDKQDTIKSTQQGVLSSLEDIAQEQLSQDSRLDGLDTTTANLELNKIETGDVQNAQVAITQATTRTNLGTNESVKSVFGKIKKWFADLKALAFKDKIVESDISGTIATTKISGLHDVATSGDYTDLENKPSITKTAIGLGNVANERQYSATYPPPYPVTKVANKTGAVVLAKADVGLGSVDNVRQYSSTNPPPYPVTKVNNKTGNVTVTKSDVGLSSVDNVKQLPLAGGTMTGILVLFGNQYGGNAYALDLQNSNIKGLNGLYWADESSTSGEGIRFYRTATTTDDLTASGGYLYFNPDQARDTTSLGYKIYHEGLKPSKSDVGLSLVDNVKQYSASNPPPYPANTGANTTVTARTALGNYTKLDDVLNYIAQVFTGSKTVSKIKANTFDTV